MDWWRCLRKRCGGQAASERALEKRCSERAAFGSRIHAPAIYLKTARLCPMSGVQQAFSEMFGLTISQGALMNLFARTARAFEEKKGQSLAALRKASFVTSDETGVRIEGVNACHWVFCCKSAVVHMADFTRSAEVVRKTMNGHQPRVWTSDRYSAQQRHGTLHQTGARDVAYGLEASEDPVPFRLKLWFDFRFPQQLPVEKTQKSATRPMPTAVFRFIGHPSPQNTQSLNDE